MLRSWQKDDSFEPVLIGLQEAWNVLAFTGRIEVSRATDLIVRPVALHLSSQIYFFAKGHIGFTASRMWDIDGKRDDHQAIGVAIRLDGIAGLPASI